MAAELHEGAHGNPLHALEPPVMDLPIPVDIAMLWIGSLVLIAMAWAARRRIGRPSRLVSLFESVYEFIAGHCEESIGAKGKAYAPFFTILFLLLCVCNTLGLIPYFKSPTASLHVNLAFATVVFLVVQVSGIRQKGIVGYLKHFVDPWWLSPIMLPIHVIDEIVRPLVLTLRLAINMMSKELMLGIFGIMFGIFYQSENGVARSLMVFPIFLRIIVLFLGVVIALIQAFVFVILSIVFVGMAMEDHEHEEHEHAEEHVHGPAINAAPG